MKTTKVIPYKNLPGRIPIWSTAVVWLVLDRLAAPGWVWGICGTIWCFIWVFSVIAIHTQEQTDPYEQ